MILFKDEINNIIKIIVTSTPNKGTEEGNREEHDLVMFGSDNIDFQTFIDQEELRNEVVLHVVETSNREDLNREEVSASLSQLSTVSVASFPTTHSATVHNSTNQPNTVSPIDLSLGGNSRKNGNVALKSMCLHFFMIFYKFIATKR